jgi:hypothetical protein
MVPRVCAAFQFGYIFQMDRCSRSSHPHCSKEVSTRPATNLAPLTLEIDRPHTVSQFLTSTLPLLFPEVGKQRGYAVVQGVVCPPETELSWLGACMVGADGWVNICIGVARG